MPFLSNKLSSSSLTVISLMLLFVVALIRRISPNTLFVILNFIIFSFALFIYIYWRNNLTRTYIEKLRDRDIRDLNTQLDTKETDLKEMKAEKERFSAIVHADNKLVPAMIQAVESFLTDFPDATPEMVARGEEILHTLDVYMQNRKDFLAEQDRHCFIKLATTGIPAVNLTLEHMYAKAQANDITLAVNVEANVDFLSTTTISEGELNTMISDLLENAIIATSYTDNKRILFTIGMLGNALSISVFDSGIPFAKEVLVDFGREKHTTHGDTGGSGTGLMAIYELARKHRATIAIEEYDIEQYHYTKRIAITFNKRNNYILNTLRDKEEIAYLRQRTDLIINLKSSKM
ncbi:MAG: HAMP domain-containing histidine kinase [Lachnospiraceae bacterium]|nr:HAMP domain-containing histidine kinase [Lachnospiraceae bacterium]